MGNAIRRKRVTNTGYQQWTEYPQSPELSGTYPTQIVVNISGIIRLYQMGTTLIYATGYPLDFITQSTVPYKYYNYVSGAWEYQGNGINYGGDTIFQTLSGILESNVNVYTSLYYDMVRFAKTTTAAQDAGEVVVWERVRNLRHKTSISYPAQGWTNYPNSPILLTEYPFQVIGYHIVSGSPSYTLICSKSEIYIGNYIYKYQTNQSLNTYSLIGGEWSLTFQDTQYVIFPSLWTEVEASHDLYTDYTLTVVKLAKTTTPEQDANETSVSSEVRARGVFRKDGTGFARINL